MAITMCGGGTRVRYALEVAISWKDEPQSKKVVISLTQL